MAHDEPSEELVRIEWLLKAAAALLPAAAARHLDDYHQYMIQGEPELAADMLALVGDQCGASPSFWFVLEAAVRAMEADGRDLGFEEASRLLAQKLA